MGQKVQISRTAQKIENIPTPLHFLEQNFDTFQLKNIAIRSKKKIQIASIVFLIMAIQSNALSRLSRSLRLSNQELIAISIYPITILLGQIIYHSSPEIVDNYYTNKHNLLNVLFVKKGWFWTCLVDVYFVLQHGKSIQRAFIRLSIITVWWWCFTQSFFGLPLMDRVFIWTGGVCDYDIGLHGALDGIGSVVCRKVKGHWKGGHDPSGHVFLLVVGSLVLWFEILNTNILQELQSFITGFRNQLTYQDRLKYVLNHSIVFTLALLWLWWWMLLTTSIHFHSFIEQMSGLIAGCLGVLVYTIPRMVS